MLKWFPVRCRVKAEVLTTSYKPPCGPSSLTPLTSAPTTISLASLCRTLASPLFLQHARCILPSGFCTVSPPAWNSLPPGVWMTHSHLFQVIDWMSPAQWKLFCPPSSYSPLGTLKNFTRASSTVTSDSLPLPLPRLLAPDLLKAQLVLRRGTSSRFLSPCLYLLGLHILYVGTHQGCLGWGEHPETLYSLTIQITILLLIPECLPHWSILLSWSRFIYGSPSPIG